MNRKYGGMFPKVVCLVQSKAGQILAELIGSILIFAIFFFVIGVLLTYLENDQRSFKIEEVHKRQSLINLDEAKPQ